MVQATVTFRDHRVQVIYVGSMAALLERLTGMDIVKLDAREAPVSCIRQGRTG